MAGATTMTVAVIAPPRAILLSLAALLLLVITLLLLDKLLQLRLMEQSGCLAEFFLGDARVAHGHERHEVPGNVHLRKRGHPHGALAVRHAV